MLGRALDSFISVFAPGYGLRRMAYRATMAQMNAVSGSQSGYQAGKINRLTKAWNAGTANENAQPRTDITRLRALSWDLYRNNAQAKKICRSLESKVIGNGLTPESHAVNADGTANVAFRTRAKQLWSQLHDKLDYRGKPGSGGQDFTELAKTALRSTILGGECLYRFRAEKSQKNKLPPVTIQLVSADRLSEDPYNPAVGSTFFYGIELNGDDQRVAYHVLRYHPSDSRSQGSISRVPAEEMRHVYIAEDIDQLRGTPWFSAALLKMRDTADYEYNELKASAIAACVVMAYSRSSGGGDFSLATGDADDLTDANGNKVSHVQPGMIVNTGRNGKLEMLNPARPTANAGEFINHLLRSQATSVPGMKGSTLTGDFRNSSFSSERSADNDTWPELESLQRWFSSCFTQPIYERVVTDAVASGWFDGVEGFDKQDFANRKEEYLRAGWQGPVARSINPVDDAEASRKRVQNGQSTPQQECALLGRNWQENLQQIKEFLDFAEANDIPESMVSQMLGIDQQDDPMGSAEPTGNTDGTANKSREDLGLRPFRRNRQRALPASPPAPQVIRLEAPAPAPVNIYNRIVTPRQDAPDFTFHAAPPANVTVNQGETRVEVQPAPAPDVTVNNPPVNFTLHTTGAKDVTKRFERDDAGEIERIISESEEGTVVQEVTKRDERGNILETRETRE